MHTEIATADRVVAIRSQVDTLLDAMGSAPTAAAETVLSDGLPVLWAELQNAKPTTLRGAAILAREAECYIGDLCAPGQAFSIVLRDGYFERIADRIEGGTHTARDEEAVRCYAAIGALAISPGHPFPRLLANAAEYLASRTAH